MNKLSKVALAWLKDNSMDIEYFLQFQPQKFWKDHQFSILAEDRINEFELRLIHDNNEWNLFFDHDKIHYEEVNPGRRCGEAPFANIYIKNEQIPQTKILGISAGNFYLKDVVDIPTQLSFLKLAGTIRSIENASGGGLGIQVFV